MSSQREAQYVARYVLTSLGEDQGDQLESTASQEVDPATGTPVEWSTAFLEKVAPVLKRGYQYITETSDHKIEMIGFAKTLVDEFSEESFRSITSTIATDDVSQLNWGRIVALFTLLSFVAAELAEKDRHVDIQTLEQWLVEFLSRDISGWISGKGGWVKCRIPTLQHDNVCIIGLHFIH